MGSPVKNEQYRLDSWKEIAAYLRRDERTVQRWEHERGLPVHRTPGARRGNVFAYRGDLDRWLMQDGLNSSAPQDGSEELSGEVSARKTARQPKAYVNFSLAVITAIASALLVFGVRAWLDSFAGPRPLGVTKLTNAGAVEWPKVLADGGRLYFSQYVKGEMRLATMPVNGGLATLVPTSLANIEVDDISADRTELLVRQHKGYEEEHELWILPLSGRPPRRVFNTQSHSACWSPGHKAIFYAVGNNIYVTPDEGRSSRLLISLQATPTALFLSNDQKHLRFELDNGTEASRWEATLNDALTFGAPTRITASIVDCCEHWIRGTDKYVVTTPRKGEQVGAASQIWDTQAATWWRKRRAPVELGARLGLINSAIAEPEGRRLFVASVGDQTSELLLFSTASQQFVPYLPGVSASYVDYSPDRSWITYARTSDATLWLSRADGSEARQLTTAYKNLDLPRWSPDGRQIAFTARQPGKSWRIFVIGVEGGTARQVSVGTDNQGGPTWSPDGKSLMYGTVLCRATMNCAIHIVDMQTGAERILPGSDGLRTARWSPDGRFVAALEPEHQQLRLFDFRTGAWRTLAENINGDDVSWSRDSRSVYTVRPIGTNPEVIRVAVDSARIETVINLESLRKLSGRVRGWFCVGPKGSIIVQRSITPTDVYAIDLPQE